MKKIIANSLVLLALLPTALHAATVSIGVGSDTFTVDGQTWTVGATVDEPVYLPGELASAAVNDGEEFIYLGASSAGLSGTVDVSLVSSHDGVTGPISLLLSASEATTWVFDPAELGVVDLRNIFVVASASTQTIQFGEQTLVLDNPGDTGSLLTTDDVARLPVLACGYKYDTSETDCNTASILGLAGDANPFGFVTHLADFFDGSPYDELQVTNFAGSHFADSFIVSIDSVAIPVPAAFWLFGSGVLGLQFLSVRISQKLGRVFSMKKPLHTMRISWLLLAAMTSTVYAQSFDALTPGAVQPEQPPAALPSFESTDIISVPDPDRRSTSREQGSTIVVNDFELVLDRSDQIGGETLQAVKNSLNKFIADHQSKLSLALLEEAAGLATDTLRDSGHILARAIVPPQEVEKGVIRLDIYVGLLGQTYVENNKFYSNKSLERAFKNQLGKSVQQKAIESSLLRVRDLPGLSAVAVFGPGEQVGETKLGIRVTEEKQFDYRLRVDNHGVDATGKLRLLGGASVNNVTGHRDRISLDAIKTFDSGDLYNARLNYEITEPALVHTFGVGYGETHYKVDQPSTLDIDGDVEVADVYVRSSWKRSRDANVSTQLGLATKRAESDSNFIFLNGVDRLTVASLSVVADGVDNRFRGLHRATLALHRGFDDFIGSMDARGNGNSLGRVPNDLQELPGRFEKISASYARLQALSANHSLLLRFAGQYSNDYLSSLEKMSLGGPNTVRAYPVSEFVAERATFASLAWVVNGSVFSDASVYGDYALGDVFNVSLFADYGWGKNRGADGSVTRREIDGAGVQFEFRLPDKNAFLDLVAAQPLDGDKALNGDDFQFWFSVGIQL